MAPLVKNHKEVTWQVLTVAAKFRVVSKFLKRATDANGKIPGAFKGINNKNPPKQDSTNLRQKFLYSLKQAYPSLGTTFINLVLDNPD